MKDYQAILFPYAYNILGSVDESKDAIQDVILKYTDAGVEADNEKNYLIKSVINQSLNRKRSLAKFQSDEHWLPEPVSTDSPDIALELRQMVSYSLLHLLETLNPKERAVFILKEAFAYSHQEIAETLSISVEGSRKLLSRASAKLKAHQPGPRQSETKYEQTLENFVDAIRNRDMTRLQDLLSKDVDFYADGGNKVKVVARHQSGTQEVADLLIHVHHKYQLNYRITPAYLNHQPALLYHYRDKLMLCQVFEFEEETSRIEQISIVLDPVKLKNIN